MLPTVMAKVICLTGGLASGKSTAARFLKEQGAHVIDADVSVIAATSPVRAPIRR
jgi:dephospho-CoA kinase/formamidopyrimidine-DNA glycosylase